jgi:hypothetical protein
MGVRLASPSRRLSWSAGTVILLVFLRAGIARAELRFAQAVASAGEVRAGAPLVHRFAFVNDGPGPVVLSELRTSCGCLVPRLEPAVGPLPRTLAPGEHGAVVLEMNTLGQSAGEHTWHVTVCTLEGGQSGARELQLHGTVVTEVIVQPASLTLFTDRAAGQDILLTDRRPRPLTVTGVYTSSPHVVGRVTAQRPGACSVRLDVDADYPEGRHDEVAELVTDAPEYRTLRVPVTVVKRARRRLTATPGAVELRAAPGQEFPAQVVLLRDGDGQAVVVERVTADDPAVICTWAQGPGALATVRVRVARSGLAGPALRSTVHVTTRQPVAATITIPVTCSAE